MKDERNSPWTFRPDPDVEALAARVLETLRWSKAKLLNEAIRIAGPVLVGQAKERIDAFLGGEEPAAVREVAKKAVARAKAATEQSRTDAVHGR